jgi:hypothetical protein
MLVSGNNIPEADEKLASSKDNSFIWTYNINIRKLSKPPISDQSVPGGNIRSTETLAG